MIVRFMEKTLSLENIMNVTVKQHLQCTIHINNVAL